MDLDSENPSLDYQREVASIYNLHLQSIVSDTQNKTFANVTFPQKISYPLRGKGNETLVTQI